MMLAAEAGHYSVVELLLQHHAETEKRNLVDSISHRSLSQYSHRSLTVILLSFSVSASLFCLPVPSVPLAGTSHAPSPQHV